MFLAELAVRIPPTPLDPRIKLDDGEQFFQFNITALDDTLLQQLSALNIDGEQVDEENGEKIWIPAASMTTELFSKLCQLGCEWENGQIDNASL